MSISFAYAQKIKPNSIIKTNNSTFITGDTKGESKSIFIENSRNIYQNRKPKLPPGSLSLIAKTNKYSLLSAFNQVFNKERIQELLPERSIFIQYYVSPSGKVLEVRFLLSSGTLITANELERLEQAIKSNVTFRFRPEETKGGDFFVLSQNVSYEKILNKTLE